MGEFGPQCVGLPLREVAAPVGQFAYVRPGDVVRRAERVEDLVDLVDLRVADKQRVALLHLCHDAPDRPDVDSPVIVLAPQQDLGSALPECDDFVSVGPGREGVGPGQAEVGQLDSLGVEFDQHVLGLEVAVEDALLVALIETNQHLAGEVSEGGVVHEVALGVGGLLDVVDDVLLEVLVALLEDELQVAHLGVDYLEQVDHVGVADLLQEGDLTQGSRGNAFLRASVPPLVELHLLDGHDLMGQTVLPFEHIAIGSIADLL